MKSDLGYALRFPQSDMSPYFYSFELRCQPLGPGSLPVGLSVQTLLQPLAWKRKGQVVGMPVCPGAVFLMPVFSSQYSATLLDHSCAPTALALRCCPSFCPHGPAQASVLHYSCDTAPHGQRVCKQLSGMVSLLELGLSNLMASSFNH